MAFMSPAVARAYALAIQPCPALALDVGTVFVGIASCRDIHSAGAEPFRSYMHLFPQDPGHFPASLKNLVKVHKPELLLVGWPFEKPGEKTICSFVQKFVENWQKHCISVPSVQVDERNSTVEAHEYLFKLHTQAGRKLHEDKNLQDQTAACIILTRFQDSLRKSKA